MEKIKFAIIVLLLIPLFENNGKGKNALSRALHELLSKK